MIVLIHSHSSLPSVDFDSEQSDLYHLRESVRRQREKIDQANQLYEKCWQSLNHPITIKTPSLYSVEKNNELTSTELKKSEEEPQTSLTMVKYQQTVLEDNLQTLRRNQKDNGKKLTLIRCSFKQIAGKLNLQFQRLIAISIHFTQAQAAKNIAGQQLAILQQQTQHVQIVQSNLITQFNHQFERLAKNPQNSSLMYKISKMADQITHSVFNILAYLFDTIDRLKLIGYLAKQQGTRLFNVVQRQLLTYPSIAIQSIAKKALTFYQLKGKIALSLIKWCWKRVTHHMSPIAWIFLSIAVVWFARSHPIASIGLIGCSFIIYRKLNPRP